MGFPTHRLRRLRSTPAVRALVRETGLAAGDLIQPLFVCPGRNVRQAIGSMPGQSTLSADEAAAEAQEAASLGVAAVILFGIPAKKDARGSGASDPEGVVQQASQAIKKAAPGLLVITDVCLC